MWALFPLDMYVQLDNDQSVSILCPVSLIVVQTQMSQLLTYVCRHVTTTNISIVFESHGNAKDIRNSQKQRDGPGIVPQIVEGQI